MPETTNRAELERRLEQVRRLSLVTSDFITKQRLDELARDIRAELDKPE